MKPVKGYEGLYSVTTSGQVWAHPNRIHNGLWLKQSLRNGYPSVDLCKGPNRRSHSVHRLVAEAFIDNTIGLPQINHKNGIKTDNRIYNLEWCDASYNKKHSWGIGTSFTTQAKREASRRNAYKMLAMRGIFPKGAIYE